MSAQQPNEEIAYCWHPKVGFYYYCSEHKPAKPDCEIREVPLRDILAKVVCVMCGKPLSLRVIACPPMLL
jgi:hypothetical protein